MQDRSKRHFEPALRRYQALLAMAGLLVRHTSVPQLFHELAQGLKNVATFDFVNFLLYDSDTNSMRLHLWEGGEVPSILQMVPVDDGPGGWVWKQQKPLVFDDLQQETRFPQVLNLLRERGIRSYCIFPMTTALQRLGGLGFGSARPSAYREADLEFLARVGELVALAVENALTKQSLNREKDRLQLLLDVSSALVSNLDLQRLFPAISTCMRRVLQHDFASLLLHDAPSGSMRIHALDFPRGTGRVVPGDSAPVMECAAGRAFVEKKIRVFRKHELKDLKADFLRRLLEEGIQSLCCVPLLAPKGLIGILKLGSFSETAFERLDQELLSQIAGQMAGAVDNARAYAEVAELKDELAGEKLYLEDEIRAEYNFEEIIGESAALKHVLGLVTTVAPSDATVLILGETGTGKELIARAIHALSSRRDGNFIKVNCAAIPTGLLESELFGHEKGAFTGAISQKVGRLELSDKGTLFLDEVGDIPLELQPKLLRLLQEHEFERLGSTRTIHVNLRLIAATNRDLARAVEEREFRRDLYYRLKVFPVLAPPLRDRRGDIPLLVRYFAQKFARRMDKHIDSIPSEAMDALMAWEWPGNVRELENLMERAVILTSGPVLRVPLAELQPISDSPPGSTLSLVGVERDLIIRVLRQTGGVLSGPGGAAARLGLKRTTLQSKMHKLGISRHDYSN
jgi:formate hydrogenlyase transcriptional activator